MSSRSKYPSKQMMIPTMPTAAATLLSGLGNFSASTVQATNSSIQNNVGVFTSESSHDNASGYFVLNSQEDLVNTINTRQAEEISAKIGQSTREIKMASITDYNITGNDGNGSISKRSTDRQ
jgi:hypothetical protein